MKFDLIVIGGGSGLDVAVGAAEQGLKVAIIEEGSLGGTCLNRGCIPSKMIIHAAEVADTIRKANVFGINAKINSIDFKRVTTRASREVDKDARDIEQSIRAGKNPMLFKSRGRFIDAHTLEVQKQKITALKIVIAAGARPFIPPIPDLEKVPYLTSTQALRLTTLPTSMIILGGGYIAAELGNFYASMGCKITVIQRGPLLIPREDKDVAELFTASWKKKYALITEANAVNMEKKNNKIVVTAQLAKQEKKFAAEKLLIATGLKPNTDLLDVAAAGVKTNQDGYVMVNKFMETNIKNIWALGDIAGVYLFKHSANLEAEYVLRAILGDKNIFGDKNKRPVNYYPMPHAIFTNPQIAGVGLTEQEAIKQKKKYKVGKYYYKDTGMGAALEEKDGFVKFIVDSQSKEILGCHILGPEASILLHEVVVAMKADRFRALDILRSAVHIHPALSEVVQRAALSVPIYH
ncbi:dihydrolipoyl dehydrogenase [Candidatus Woesearchaeota archaeon]|nr:dihydrolipoyl dehydrogenase [Candidatus Woesearchaeota archaeon]